ncbi:MAG TPA: hypothetical protein VGW78_06550 [Candidatus Babeliales bacterium]|nr:hypothetical protein [Candidatus Babeliales bacterium]
MKNYLIVVLCLGVSGISYTSEKPHYAPETPQSEVLKKLAAYRKTAQLKKKMGYAKGAATGATVFGAASMAFALAIKGLGASKQEAAAMVASSALTGALSLTLLEAFGGLSSPEWIAQLEKLEKAAEDGKIDSIKFAHVGGFPEDIMKQNPSYEGIKGVEGRIYFLSQRFNDISSLHEDGHYEVYLMPQDEYLVDVFLSLFGDFSSFIDEKDPYYPKLLAIFDAFKEFWHLISFIIIRPTPGVSTSVYNGKYLPRIIIGLNETVDQETAHNFVEQLKQLLVDFIAAGGIGYHPRYSEEIPNTNKFIYAAYGSGDYKDTQAGQQGYASMKSKSWWRFISRDIEDMAYKSEDQRVSKTPWPEKVTKPTFGEYLKSRSVPGDIIPSRNPPQSSTMQPYVDPTISGPLIQPLKK